MFSATTYWAKIRCVMVEYTGHLPLFSLCIIKWLKSLPWHYAQKGMSEAWPYHCPGNLLVRRKRKINLVLRPSFQKSYRENIFHDAASSDQYAAAYHQSLAYRWNMTLALYAIFISCIAWWSPVLVSAGDKRWHWSEEWSSDNDDKVLRKHAHFTGNTPYQHRLPKLGICRQYRAGDNWTSRPGGKRKFSRRSYDTRPSLIRFIVNLMACNMNIAI